MGTTLEEWQSEPTVWASVDGAAWTQRAVPGGATALCSVTATSDAFFGLGFGEGGQPTAWRTPDGVDWTAGTLPTEVVIEPGSDVTMMGCNGRVVELSDGYLAYVSDDEVTLTWTSGDGMTWEEGAVLDMRTDSDSIAAIGDTIVAFGRRGPLYEDQAQALFVGTVIPAH